MASTYMKSDDVSTLYISQARQLEDQGKFKEAEKYVNIIQTCLCNMARFLKADEKKYDIYIF